MYHSCIESHVLLLSLVCPPCCNLPKTAGVVCFPPTLHSHPPWKLANSNLYMWAGGTRWHSWLRHCATSRKVAGSVESIHWHNPSGRTMTLGLTQPLTEMSSRNNSWGSKGDRCVGLTTLPPSCAGCLEIWEPQPPGTLRACPGL